MDKPAAKSSTKVKTGKSVKSTKDYKQSKPNEEKPSASLANRDKRRGKVTKQVRWVTRAMAEDISKEAVLETTFKETIYFLAFVIVISISVTGRGNAAKFYMVQALRNQFLHKDFDAYTGKDMQFDDISTISDFWHFAETLMIDSLFSEKYYDPYDDDGTDVKPDDRKILFQNQLLGVPRIRQVRVRNDSCRMQKYFRSVFNGCYGHYSHNAEDVSPFGIGNGTAWTYNSQSETKHLKFRGRIHEYGGGGYYSDLTLLRDSSIEIITDLEKNLWITRETRAVFVHFTLYNTNLNLFCICRLLFEIPPSGGVVTTGSFRPVALFNYMNNYDYFILCCKCITLLFILYYLFEELREIVYFKWKYLFQFWSYIDLLIIFSAVTGTVPGLLVDISIDSEVEYITKNPEQYANLERLSILKMLNNDVKACTLFLVYIKIFKYLNFNRTMGQLNNTLKRCSLDIVGFSCMFFIVFFAFSILGYLLFGNQVLDYFTVRVTMFTLLRTILGDFEYDPINEVNKYLAPVFFVTFIFLVFFVLINMFLAIINDAYADVKTEIAIAPKEKQMTDYIKHLFNSRLRKWGFKFKAKETVQSEYSISIDQIREVLKKCCFSDLEIEMFFSKYNIDPLCEFTDFNINKLIAEFDGKSRGKDKSVAESDNSLVQLNDFIAQQDRLEQIENILELLHLKVDSLLTKLKR